MSTIPIEAGDRVCLADPAGLAADVWRMAANPGDPNAQLAVELNQLSGGVRPEVTITSVEPDGDGWYVGVRSPLIVGGDVFGVRSTDLAPQGSGA